ncbi:MAG: sensor histidine kinase [Candidatus Omnitrophota bacterium]
MLIKGIKLKLVLSLVVTTLVVMSVFIFILNRYLMDYSIRDAEKTINFLGNNASNSLQSPLFNGDYNQVIPIAKSIKLEDFDYVIIFDNLTKNKAFAEDSRYLTDALNFDEIVKGQRKQTFQKLKLKEENYTQYLFPISIKDIKTPLGYLIFGVSEKRMQSKLQGITVRIVLISLLLFLTLAALIYFLSDRIVNPIKDLSEKIGKFASGDYSVRSNIKTNDEIQDLSENFNIMADKIAEQIISIEKYSKNLEQMVEERTDELLKAIDALREKDTQLLQAEKINSLNSIVSSIAHEINNPLAIISGNLQLIDSKSNAPLVQKKLKIANDAIERIAKLIDEINFFSSIKDITIEVVNLGTIVSSAAGNVIPKDVTVHINSAVEDDRIQSNTHLLSVTIENILKNSAEMIVHRKLHESGEIQIRYFKEPPYFILEFTDNAGGFDDIQKAFDPFYSTFEQKKGLGLTFVYHAIKALNGEIKLDNIENGAKVLVMLPLEITESKEKPWLP